MKAMDRLAQRFPILAGFALGLLLQALGHAAAYFIPF